MTEKFVPVRIPESMGPQEIGPYIRELREHFKLTPLDVSERLHIRVRYVNAIEEARYDQMPGKVYARGYVHTYAEFLGLDPDLVVAQCFPPMGASPLAAPAVEEKKAPLSASSKPAHLSDFSPKPPPLMRDQPKRGNRGLVLLGAAALLALLAYTQLGGAPEKAADEEIAVAQVPESLLASVRGTVMPQANNYQCLTGTLLLSCAFANEGMRLVETLAVKEEAVQLFLTGIDTESLAVAAPVAEPAPVAESAEDE